MSGEDNLLKLVDAPAPKPGYRLQEQVGFLLRKANQRHVAIFAAKIGDLTPPQFAALAMLGECGEASQSQLGTLVAMDGATVKGVLDRLTARGLVAQQPDESDRRRLLVRLTQAGRDRLATLVGPAREATEATLAPLSRSEAEMLLELLARIA